MFVCLFVFGFYSLFCRFRRRRRRRLMDVPACYYSYQAKQFFIFDDYRRNKHDIMKNTQKNNLKMQFLGTHG